MAFEANTTYYHINLSENFKVEAIEHETEKSYLFKGPGYKFWCPKKLIRTMDKKDITKWLVWNKFEANFIEDEKTVLDPMTELRKTINKSIDLLKDMVKIYLNNPCDTNYSATLDSFDELNEIIMQLAKKAEAIKSNV